MLCHPPNVDHWPSQNSGPVVKISAKLLLNTLRYANFQKILACGGLIRVEIIPLQILRRKHKFFFQENTNFYLQHLKKSQQIFMFYSLRKKIIH